MSSLGLGRWGKRGKYPSLKTERISKTFTRQQPAVLAVRLDGVQLGRGVSHLLSGLPAAAVLCSVGSSAVRRRGFPCVLGEGCLFPALLLFNSPGIPVGWWKGGCFSLCH